MLQTNERPAPSKSDRPSKARLAAEHSKDSARADRDQGCVLRTITNDDGHFCGLEVSHG